MTDFTVYPNEDGYMVYRPSLGARMWRALGFRSAYVARPDGDDAKWMITNVVARFDFLDRLRILVTGTVAIQTCSETEHDPGRVSSISDVSVAPPGERP